MKVEPLPEGVLVELSRRNLEVLLAKLDDPDSARTIHKDGVWVHAVENHAHYAEHAPGRMLVHDTII